MAGGAFDKDFGYLMPFLDKVAAAAATLPDQAARDELLRLVADEKSKWNRIRALLSGVASAPASVAEKISTEKTSSAVKPPAASANEFNESSSTINEAFSFTVGSLRPRTR